MEVFINRWVTWSSFSIHINPLHKLNKTTILAMATSSYEWKRLERERRTPFIQTSMNELKITDKLKAFFLSFVYCMVSKYKRQIWVSDQPQTVCKNVCVGIPPIITDGCSSRTLARWALEYVGEHVIETVLLTVLVHCSPCTIPSSSFFFYSFQV